MLGGEGAEERPRRSGCRPVDAVVRLFWPADSLSANRLYTGCRAASRKQRRRELCSAPSGLTLRVNLSRFETGSGPDACRQTGLLIVVVVVC